MDRAPLQIGKQTKYHEKVKAPVDSGLYEALNSHWSVARKFADTYRMCLKEIATVCSSTQGK